MKRREFLTTTMATSLIYGSGAAPGIISGAAADFAAIDRPILANLILLGGPDFRHVLPPAFSSQSASYGNQFWRNRARANNQPNSNSALSAYWNDNFFKREAQGKTFGIARHCQWLRDMWDDGNVAIVCNVVGSTSRDHEHSILIMDQGNRFSGPNDFERSGWGGRLASAASANAVSLTSVPRHFCYGLHTSGDINRYDKSNLVSAADTRGIGLYTADLDRDQRWDRAGQMARTLKSYYAGLRQSMDANSPYQQFLDHESKLREFGAIIDGRLSTVPEPTPLKQLYDWDHGARLSRPQFGLQLRNLHDALACSDLLDMRVASLDYGGWDSHEGQANMLEPKFRDLFGRDRGFDRLWNALPGSAKDNLVITIQGEFGRQLKDNGGNGTDHGRGNCMLVIGRPVNGGVYGDMFPESELARLDDWSPDIEGKTDIDHLFGAVCDWVHPGSATTVFPNIAGAKLEPGVDFSTLFTTA